MKMMVASQTGKRDFLDRLVVKRLLLKEAKKDKIEKEKEFQDRLNDIREQLLIESLLKKKVTAETQFSDEDLQKYYDAHKEEFKKGQEIQTRQILLKTEQEAKEIQARIAKGEDFAQLARQFSIDPSAKSTGGDIGYHPKGSLIPEFEEAAFKLTKVGQVTPPVKTQLGYHLIKLEGIRTGTYVPFPEVKDFIRQKLGQEKQTEVLKKYIDDLKKNAKIVVNEQAIKDDVRKGAAPAKSDAGGAPSTGGTESTGKPAEAKPDEAGKPGAPQGDGSQAGKPAGSEK